MPGGAHVASAERASTWSLAAQVGYAYTEPLTASDATHHRGSGDASLAVSPHESLILSASGGLRIDGHRLDGSQRDSGRALGSRLAARGRHSLGSFDLGLELALGFPPAKGIERGLSAMSPEALAIGSFRATPRLAFAFNAGYRLERSERAISDPGTLSGDDLISAQLSGSDQVLLGVLASTVLSGTTFMAECSWDVQIGAKAPPPLASPLRLELSGQRPFETGMWLGASLGFSPSTRPEAGAAARIVPRAWGMLSVGYAWDTPRDAAPRAAEAGPKLAPADTRRSVELWITDSDGAPIPGARVTLLRDGKESKVEVDAEGRATIVLEGPESASLRIEAPGHQPMLRELDAQESDTAQRLDLQLEKALPEGQIRGSVRDLRGRPLSAQVQVEPLGLRLSSDAQGGFECDVPPGEYTVRVSAPGYEPQDRPASVEQHGVTILVVDLRKLRGGR